MDRPLSVKNINQQKRAVWLKALTVVVMLTLFIYSVNWLFAPSVNRANLRTAKVFKQTITATINAGGLVVPMVEETISSEIASHVSQVFVRPGQNISKGDLIIQLDTQKLMLAIDKIKEQVALKDSQIKTKKLIVNRSINDIGSRIELLEVDLESRMTKQNKLNKLSFLGTFSSQDLLEAELNVKRTNIEIRQLNQSIADLKSATKAEIETLNLEKSIFKKALAEQLRLEQFASVKATRSGILSWLKQDAGSSVSAGQPLAKIVDDSHFRIEATLSDFYASQLVPNMSAEITYQNQKLNGKLAQQTPTIENGVMKLSINLERPDNTLLKNNLRVDVGLIIKTIEGTLALSKGPYTSGRGIQNVFVIRNNTAYRTEVEIGLGSAKNLQISRGLSENDEVIISDVSEYLHLTEFAIN
ncbi:MAG: HlyD family secretion protein [Glaciecola sp.]|jgi:HlyD family secretion protein